MAEEKNQEPAPKNNDMFLDFMESSWRAIEPYKGYLLGLIVIGLLGLASVTGYEAYKESNELAAQTDYFQIEKKVTKAQENIAKEKAEDKDFEKTFGPLLSELESFAKEESGSKASVRAMLKASEIYVNVKQFDKALESLRWAEVSASEDILYKLFNMNFASRLMDNEKYAEAIGRLETYSFENSFESLYSMAQFKKAISLEKLGKTEEAKTIYKRLSSDFPDTETGRKAKYFLRLM
ncbi:MAG: tetratricopeptide repeat protein [Bdellovibrionales bacterium]